MKKPSEHTQPDKAALDAFCRIVEEQLSWGSSDQWRSRDFESLGQRIYDKTEVSLSTSTLKRIFGKLQYDGMQNTTTLDALAQFIDFENWLQFKESLKSNGQDMSSQHEDTGGQQEPDSESQPGLLRFNRRVLVVVMALVLLIVLGFVWINSYNHVNDDPSRPGQEPTSRGITFTSDPVAEGIPNTVVFHYNIPGRKPKHAEIQQSWDETKRFEISPEGHEATSIYYYPGYFRAKLVLDGQIVKEHDLFVKSNGWLATLNTDPKPRYFLANEIADTRYLTIEPVVIAKAQVTRDTPEVIGYHYVGDFGDLMADDMIFECAIRNTYFSGNGVCQQSRIVLLGTEGFVIIPFSIPGCTSDLRLVVNDVVHDGKSNDLSKFGCDFQYWQKVACSITEHRARIYLNDRIIYGVTYTGGLGRFVGMRFLFAGSGDVDDVVIRDASENVFFSDYFQKGNKG